MSKKVIIIASQEAGSEPASNWYAVLGFVVFAILFCSVVWFSKNIGPFIDKTKHVAQDMKIDFIFNHSDIKERMAKYGLRIEQLRAMRDKSIKSDVYTFTEDYLHSYSIDRLCHGQRGQLFTFLISGNNSSLTGEWEYWTQTNNTYRLGAYVMCEGSDKLYYNIQNPRYAHVPNINDNESKIEPIEVEYGKYE